MWQSYTASALAYTAKRLRRTIIAPGERRMATIRIPLHVKAVVDKEGAVLLDVRNGTYFSLNDVGVDIWQQLESGSTLLQVRTYLVETYAAPTDMLLADLDAFIERLRHAHLIDTVEE
jgi:hypothetical protein